jgi:hypothetical protein
MKARSFTPVAAVAALALAGCGLDTTTHVTTTTKAQTPTTITTDRDWASPSRDVFTFKGNGTKNLGTISVAYNGTITWTNDAPTPTANSTMITLFSIIGAPATANSPSIIIQSQASSGTSAVSAGVYQNVQVASAGSWTIRITAVK